MDSTMEEKWNHDIHKYESKIKDLQWEIGCLEDDIEIKKKSISRYKSLIKDRKLLIENNYE